MRGTQRHRILAVAMAVALLLPGCDLLEPPLPLKPADNVGVDPTGESLDTGTLPPDQGLAEEEPFTASAPPVRKAPPQSTPPSSQQRAPSTREETRSASTGIDKTGAPTGSTSSSEARVGTSGTVHHHRKRSSNEQ